jgi:hypothetical protein
MSRNSKNARNLAKARQITAMHKNGEKGASKTAPQHGKKWTYRHNPDAMKRLAEALKGAAAPAGKTAGAAILAKAGGASKVAE